MLCRGDQWGQHWSDGPMQKRLRPADRLPPTPQPGLHVPVRAGATLHLVLPPAPQGVRHEMAVWLAGLVLLLEPQLPCLPSPPSPPLPTRGRLVLSTPSAWLSVSFLQLLVAQGTYPLTESTHRWLHGSQHAGEGPLDHLGCLFLRRGESLKRKDGGLCSAGPSVPPEMPAAPPA